jgi:uncharacterized protein YecT (DUF1311 family)
MKGGYMKNFLCLIFVLSTIQLSVSGEQSGQRQGPCDKAETTVELNECAAKEYKLADAELNKTYKQVMARFGDEGYKSALRESHLAWLKYRDLNCDFQSYMSKAGSIHPIEYAFCRTEMTQARTSELKRMLKDFDRLMAK